MMSGFMGGLAVLLLERVSKPISYPIQRCRIHIERLRVAGGCEKSNCAR